MILGLCITPNLLTSAFKENGYNEVNISRKPHEELNILGAINPVASMPLKSDKQRRPWTI